MSRPSTEMVSGYSDFRKPRNSSLTKAIIAEASPLESPMKPSIEQAMK